MAKLKKVLLMCTALVLVAGLSIGGTMAYLQAEDSDVNVMTLGNVEIEQIEQEWNEDKTALQDFTQAKPLYPYVGEFGWDTNLSATTDDDAFDVRAYRRFSMNNVVDKYVSVQNVGKSDAYVRTLVALEMGSVPYEEFDMVGISVNLENGSEFKFPGAWNMTDRGVIAVEGHNYNVIEFVHRDAVKPGETTIPSLLQVYLSKDATNEDCEALDGNSNGLYDILVLSQAVQTAGFENAAAVTVSDTSAPSVASIALNAGFGEVTADNEAVVERLEEALAETYTGALASYEDMIEARGTDGTYILAASAEPYKTENIVHFGPDTNVTLDLNDQTVVAEKTDQFAFGAQQGSSLHLTGNGTVNMGKGFMANKGGAEIVIDGGTYNTTVTTKLNGMVFHSLAQNNAKIVINDGTFTSNVDGAGIVMATSNARVEITGGFFENTADKTPDLLHIGTNKNNTNRIIITGGTFVNYNPLEDKMCYTGEWPENGEAAFGGPWILIPGGYEVVSETQANGDIWYTVVAK